MNCKKCGNILTSEIKFCPNCGELNELYVEGVETPVESTVVESGTPVEPAPIETPVESVEPVEPAPVETPVEPKPESVEPVTPSIDVPPIVETPVVESTPVAPVPEKKSNVGFIIIVIVLSLLIVGLGIFIAIKLLGGNTSDTPTVTTTEPTPVVETNTEKGTEVTKTDNSNTLEINGYKFIIPSGFELIDNSSDGHTYVGNANFCFPTDLSIITTDVTYDAIVENSDLFINTLKNNNPEVTTAYFVEETYSGQKYAIIRGTMEVNGRTLPIEGIFTELSDGAVFFTYATGTSLDNIKSNYPLFTTFVKSGKLEGTSSLSSFSKDSIGTQKIDINVPKFE